MVFHNHTPARFYDLKGFLYRFFASQFVDAAQRNRQQRAGIRFLKQRQQFADGSGRRIQDQQVAVERVIPKRIQTGINDQS